MLPGCEEYSTEFRSILSTRVCEIGVVRSKEVRQENIKISIIIIVWRGSK